MRDWTFYHFDLERNYGASKSKSACFLVGKNVKFNKNKTESKMKNLTHAFRQTKLQIFI